MEVFTVKVDLSFFLTFLVCNLSMCAIGLPLWALMMLSSAAMESSILCSLHRYFMFSIGGTSLLNIGLLSVNYYFCVVKYTLYDRVYTTRNICILLCVVWLIWPIFLLFPLFEIWSEFTFDQLRFICSPLNGSYRNAVGIVDFLLSCPPILFCYVEILRTSKASKVKSLQNENIQRNKIAIHLIRTIICLITVYSVLNLPLLFVTLLDSEMKVVPLWVHNLALYFGMSTFTVNSLVYSVLNQKVKSLFRSFVCRIFSKKINAGDYTENITEHTYTTN